MNIIEIERSIIRQLHELPVESAEEVLGFVMLLTKKHRSQSRSSRRLIGKKRYTIVDLGGTEPDLMVPSRRREGS